MRSMPSSLRERALSTETPPDPTRAIRSQPARHSGVQFQHEERRVYPDRNPDGPCRRVTGIDNTGFRPALSAGSTRAEGRRQEPCSCRSTCALNTSCARNCSGSSTISPRSRRRANHGRQHRRSAGHGVAARFRSEPPRRGGPDHPELTTPTACSTATRSAFTNSGSIFKIFTVAMALDAGTSTLTSTYDASHDIHIGRFTSAIITASIAS